MADQPLTDDVLAAALVRGPQPVWVTLSEYNPVWPARFEASAAQLRQVLGDRARLIEHIGSTSVPGLAAKPVIDIVVGLDDPDDESAYLPDLEAVGYDLRVREPSHRCLRVGDPHEPVNLHCYPPYHVEVRKTAIRLTTWKSASTSCSAIGSARVKVIESSTKRPNAPLPSASGRT